ncbi:CAF17-like 4Fe-4S cluster assembly/insertion protein YgfZ [Homoserinibacter sp. YIM 151385]|uniref:CAF17-like 4Fe-4S cluster assembly/insertion protein YgfZ n=1 Tax=Homoserinibacter sp. YIM 151385 TaxID=2985506 RepID=UPI0022F04FFF|nr:glycine cleavage T C-terminal barrel domain-containing protein [Homoserinibacter sp. YIM 151385]WBU39309.1 folate-binding protein [Homoserinibacter sp. YIM 151385]
MTEQLSPFAALPGAVGSPPQHYGDLFGEQRRLAAGEAVVDLSDRAVVSVTGPDRLTWLDSLTSQRLTGLAPGDSAETLLLDPSGRIEVAARAIDDGETLWLLVDGGAGERLAAFLTRMRFTLRVEVADRTAELATLGALGEPAALLAAAASPAGVPLVWRDAWSGVQPGGHQYALVAEHPGAGWNAIEVLVPRAELPALAASGIPLAGSLALEALRIAAWRPRLEAEVDSATIPHELDWLRTAVHLTKGCYRGQETVAKVHNLGHPPRRLVLLHLDGSDSIPVRPGDEVLAGEKSVGRVTSAAQHHELGPIALAVVKRSAPVGEPLLVRGEEGEVAAAQEVVVPPEAGAEAGVPRLPRLGAVRRPRS